MEGESGVTGSIIHELHSSDIQRDHMERERGLNRSIMEELHSWDMEGYQMEGLKHGNTRSIIDELHSWDIQGDPMECESMMLLEVSSMNFILAISKETKWKVKVLYSKYHRLTSVLRYPWRSNGRWKWCYF